MALIALPTKFSFTRVERFALVRQSNMLRSRFTGQGQRVTYPYAVWEFEAKLVDYDGLEAGLIRSFLAKLEGIENTFKLPVPGYEKPSTGFPSNLAVTTAAAARATSIEVRPVGGQINTPVFNEGDYFTVNDELKMVTQAVATGAASGTEPYPLFPKIILNFKPALRKPVAYETHLILQNPYCLMHAVDDDVAKWGLAPPVRHGLEIKAIEAVEI